MWKKKVGKVFAGVLTLVMLTTSVPNMVYATENDVNTGTEEQTVSDGDTGAVAVNSLEIGEYTFNNGVLTITSVEEAYYPEKYAWDSLSGQITKVVFADSVTTVPNNLFYDINDSSKYDSITEVDLGNVSEIGRWAFFDCNGITKVYGGAQNLTVPITGGDFPFTVISSSPAIWYENQILKNAEASGGNRRQAYRVSFDSQGGTPVESQFVTMAVDIIEPISTKEGYKFECWSYEGKTYDAFNSRITLSNSDITLYAQWEELIKVTFNTGNYATVIDPVYVERNTTVARPDVTPTKPGYIFDDWYKVDESAGSLLKNLFDFSSPIINETTVYAHWDNVYTVTFNSLGGTYVESQTVVEGGKTTVPTEPTKDGYTFKGWFTDVDCTTEFDFNTEILRDTTLYAKWEAVEKYCTVKFIIAGETLHEKQLVVVGDKATVPTVEPTRNNYKFGGWYTDTKFNTEFDFNTPITADTRIYAKWLITHKLKFNCHGGTAIESQVLLENETTVRPADPTRENYKFDGWYTTSDCTTEFVFNTTINVNMTAHAKWIPYYKVTFIEEEKGEILESQSILKDECAIKPQNAPALEDWIFVDWYTDKKYTTKFDFDAPITKNTIVYAKYKKYYNVQFESFFILEP